ncbi:MAG: hypothetical protein K2I75_02380 [Clostridiales bacterium]|nr:hypothetical protein [Clostridiales bacterium]
MRRASVGVKRCAPPHKPRSPLAKYGSTDTCRGVMRAYALYRYNLLKSRYEK